MVANGSIRVKFLDPLDELWETLWEKDIMVVTSIFSFSHFSNEIKDRKFSCAKIIVLSVYAFLLVIKFCRRLYSLPDQRLAGLELQNLSSKVYKTLWGKE